MRLIDADALIAQWESDAEEMEEFAFKMATYGAINDVKRQPTIEPRRKGKWQQKEVFDGKDIIEEWQTARCSVCGRYHTVPYTYYFQDDNYCPYCGADMREGGEE